MNAQHEFVYDPNINVIPGSPDSTITIASDLLDGIEELFQDDNESVVNNISELPIYFDDGVVVNNEVELFTKSGELRKRKKYLTSVEMRKKIKLDLEKDRHGVLPGCDKENCQKQCYRKITEERRFDVNFQYWNMTWKERRVFILSTCQCVDVKTRKNTELTNRKNALKFYITDDQGIKIQVCKPFFLTTLGFKKTNDRVLDILRHYPNGQVEAPDDLRGKKPTKKNQVSKKNISFTVLGHEECEVCESLKIHEHAKDNLVEDCEICQTYSVHKQKANVARALYQEHAKNEFDAKSIYVTKKTYDFEDFAKAVGAANKGNVKIKKMSFSDFFQWKDYKAQQKLLKSTNRVLLRDIVSIKAERGKYVLFTKSQFNDEQYTT
ncbi:hypothetical protein ACI65C_006469 [Semiaphis heraclei]